MRANRKNNSRKTKLLGERKGRSEGEKKRRERLFGGIKTLCETQHRCKGNQLQGG